MRSQLGFVTGLCLSAAAFDKARSFSIAHVLLPPLSSKPSGGANEIRQRSVASRSPSANSLLGLEERGGDSCGTGEEDTQSRKQIATLRRTLNIEFLSIAIPAYLQQAAEPIAGLVDTAYLGRLGPDVLGGVGVALAAQAAVSKLYNSPLSKTTISLIGSKVGARKGLDYGSHEDEDLSVAVSSGLLLAIVVGIIQLLVFSVLAPLILNIMGVSQSSGMWRAAVSYMRVKALGAPGATLWLVCNGIFRGLGDTKTTLFYSLLFNGLNFALDGLFINVLKLGAGGAALATIISQYVFVIPLLLDLNKRVSFDVYKQLPALIQSLKMYLEAGAYLLGQTAAKVLAFTYCTRQSALLGPVAASAYNITFQLGFAITLLCESVTVATQSLLSREIGNKSRPKVVRSAAINHIMNGSVMTGVVLSLCVSLVSYMRRTSYLSAMTTSLEVREAAWVVFPAFLLTQVLKGVAHPVSGIIMGGLDWKFSMLSTWIANAVCIGTLQLGSSPVTVARIWIAWAAFMTTQAITGLVRVKSRTGVWKTLANDDVY